MTTTNDHSDQNDSEQGSTTTTATHSLRQVLGVTNHGVRPDTAPPPIIVGHRGALYHALENTLPSFQQCVTWQCPAVELDVYVIRDGSVVVFHGNDADPSGISGSLLDQFTNLAPNQHSIMELTYDECQHLQFNPHFPEFAGTGLSTETIQTAQIPLLRDVLLALKDTSTKLKIELKGPGTVRPVLDLVESLDMISQCSYSSFDLAQIQELRGLRPDRQRYPTGALFGGGGGDATLPENLVALARDEYGATELHLPYDWCTVARLDEIHAAGLTSMAWMRGPVGMTRDLTTKYHDVGTAEGEACYQALLDTGVHQLCVNKPNVALQMLLQQRGQQHGPQPEQEAQPPQPPPQE
ncbi:hypothetical protein ACA910_017422 [Epithemia clementina (nom. ined.)]